MSRKKTTIGKNNLNKIGGRIQSLQNSTGLSQTEFGKSIGISQSSVSDLVRGLYPPSDPVLLAIQNRYSLKPDEILTGKGFSLKKVHPYLPANDDKKQILSILDVEVPVYTKRINDLVISLKNLLTGFEDRFNDMESRLTTLEEKKDITRPGPAEEVIEKKVT